MEAVSLQLCFSRLNSGYHYRSSVFHVEGGFADELNDSSECPASLFHSLHEPMWLTLWFYLPSPKKLHGFLGLPCAWLQTSVLLNSVRLAPVF